MKYIYKARCGGSLFGSQHLEARGRRIRDFKANPGSYSESGQSEELGEILSPKKQNKTTTKIPNHVLYFIFPI